MKQSKMKHLVALAPCLFLPNVEASRILDVVSKLSRQDQRERETFANGENSNDLIDMLTFQIYNCEGMFLDWSGPSTATGGYSSTVVEYDYDLIIEKGSDLNTALASLQHALLRQVGPDIFAGCSRRLTIGGQHETERQLGGSVIEELTSAPSDQPALTSSCRLESASTDTECIPIAGFLTAYYLDDGSTRRLDESSVQDAISASIQKAMDNGSLETDTTRGIQFLGDRETFAFESEESYLEEAAVGDVNKNAEPDTSGAPWALIGGGVGLLAILFLGVLYKKRPMKKEVEVEETVAVATEEGQPEPEEESPQAEAIEADNVKDEEEATLNERLEYSEGHGTSPAACDFLNVLACGKEPQV